MNAKNQRRFERETGCGNGDEFAPAQKRNRRCDADHTWLRGGKTAPLSPKPTTIVCRNLGAGGEIENYFAT